MKLFSRRESLLLLFLLIASLVALRYLFYPGIWVSHDAETHIARLASFILSLRDGIWFPRWGANLNYGLGHPTLMFLYPLPNYFGAVLYALGLNLTDTVKLLFGLGYILSGYFMYLLLKELFGKLSAVFGAIVYLFAPYRFADIFVRGAFPEHLFFTLAPLCLWLWLKYYKSPSPWRLAILSVSLGAIILVHNAAAFIFFPFMWLWCVSLILDRGKRPWLTRQNLSSFAEDHGSETAVDECASASADFSSVKLKDTTPHGVGLGALFIIFLPFILGALLAFYYWFPALVEGKYTFRNLIFSKAETLTYLTQLRNLLLPSWGFGDPRFAGGLSLQIGIGNLWVLFMALGIFLTRFRQRYMYAYLLFVFLTSAYLMTTASRWIWENNGILYLVRFPWRFLLLIVLVCPILAAIVIYRISLSKELPRNFLIALVAGLSGILIYLSWSYQRPQALFVKPDTVYFQAYPGSADGGESTPIWSTLTPQLVSEPFNIAWGSAKISNINKRPESHTFTVNVVTDRANVVDNTLYFPGWRLLIDGQDQTGKIEFQNPEYRGLMTFWLEKGEHQVKLVFTNTRVRQVSEWVSLVTLIGVIIFTLQKRKRRSRS